MAEALAAGSHLAFTGALVLFLGSIVVTVVLVRPEGLALRLRRPTWTDRGSERYAEDAC
jgi:hypothetical protein